MARKTTRQHPQGEASRAAILDATLRIAGQRGYVGTTMAQVTQASRLPASSVYWHFGTKDDLLAEALDHGLSRWNTAVAAWNEPDTALPLVDRLLDRLQTVIRTTEAEQGFWRMGMLIALETGPQVGSGPQRRFVSVRQRSLARLADWWRPSLTRERGGLAALPETIETQAHTMALLTLTTLDGLFLARQSDPEEDIGPTLRLVSVGLDAAARRLSTGVAATPRPTAPTSTPGGASDTGSSRGRLLEAAAVVAAESGYDGASISRICKRAGLPASSLYWHFKNKDDLLAAVIEHSYEEWFLAQPMWRSPDRETPWQDALRAHLSVTLRSLADRPLFMRMGHLLLLLQREDPPAARSRFIAVRDEARRVSREWYVDALGPDADPEVANAMGMLTMVLADGLFFSNQVDSPTWDVDLFIELAVAMLGASPHVAGLRDGPAPP